MSWTLVGDDWQLVGTRPARRDQLGHRAAVGKRKSALAKEFGISRETVYTYLRPH